MHHSLVIIAIILTGALAASKGADDLDDRGNDAQDQTKVYADFMKAFDSPQCHLESFTRNGDFIYVLCLKPSLKSIRVFEDSQPFDLLMVIWLDEVKNPAEVVASQASGCLYVFDSTWLKSSIWKITIDQHIVSEFLSDVQLSRVNGISVSTDGQLVVFQSNKTSQFMEIYSQDAALVRRLDLPSEAESPGSQDIGILKPNGEPIILYASKTGNTFYWVISLVTADGKITTTHVTLSNTVLSDSQQCFLFETDDQAIGFNSESTCFPNSPMSYLILEELVVPLLLNFYNATRQSYNILLLDVKLAFGIHSTKSQIVYHKCY